MTEPTKAEKLPVAVPCVASVLCLLSLLFMGWTAPVFLEMFRDFGVDPLPYPLRLISHLHWHWTLPLGGLIAAGLLWSARHWPRRTTLAVDAVAMALAVLVLVAFFFTMFRPIFRVNGAVQRMVPGALWGHVVSYEPQRHLVAAVTNAWNGGVICGVYNKSLDVTRLKVVPIRHAS